MNIKICLSALASLLLAVCSCGREQFVEEGPQTEGNDDARLVYVTLNLDVASLQAGTENIPANGQTRAINDPADYNQTLISDLWVLQFDGTDDDALLSRASYVKPYTAESSIGLLESVSDNRIVLIANTCNANLGNTTSTACIFIPGVTTPSSLEQARKDLITSNSATSCSPDAIFGSDSGTQYQPLYGSFVQTISSSMTSVSCTLERTIARLDFHLALNTTDVKLLSAQLVNVPSKTIYYSGHLSTASADANEVFIPGQPYIKYTAMDLSLSMTASGDAADFTYYVPATIWGTKSASTDEQHKPDFIPNATRLVLKGETTDSKKFPVTYTFVLGSNMTNDFSLRPGYQYRYNIDITKVGDPANDHRVMIQREFDDDMRDFRTDNPAELSNCYILHPPFAAGATREFKIPLDRIRQFWGEYPNSSNPDYEYDENLNFSGQSQSVKWRAEVLWSDFPIDGNNFWLEDNEGMGLTRGINGSYFTAVVAAGTSGNVVVTVSAVRENSDGSETKTVCWSWHLWITDYDPDYCIAKSYTPAEGQYIYTVPGGEVHRYAGSYWSSGGLYENKFMMDRNVGCLTANFTGSGRGNLFFQFGRKDPFPGILYYLRGNPSDAKSGRDNLDVIAAEDVSRDTHNNPTYHNVPYSVKNPLMYISGTYWTYNDKYNPAPFNANIIWNDPTTKTTPGKSIFDPCPQGWCIPEAPACGVWNDLRVNRITDFSTNVNPTVSYTPVGGFAPINLTGRGGSGLLYWPYSQDSPVVEGGIYMPFNGLRRSISNERSGTVAGRADGCSYCLYWSSSVPYSSGSGYYIYVTAVTLGPSPYNKASGLAVRCIQEKAQASND